MESLLVDINLLKEYFESKNILVSGGASFIGSHLTDLLVLAGAQVVVADDLSSGKLAHLEQVSNKIKFLKGDLRDPAFAKDAAQNMDLVFHLAAAHGGRGYIESHPVAVSVKIVVPLFLRSHWNC